MKTKDIWKRQFQVVLKKTLFILFYFIFSEQAPALQDRRVLCVEILVLFCCGWRTERGQISEMLFQEGQRAGWAPWMPGAPVRLLCPHIGARERTWFNLFCFLFSIT